MHQTDLSRVDLNLLVLYEAVWEERHVGRAAERLSLSPSAVSHGLARLRKLLHDPLFLKTPKGVVPTARGAELAEPIAAALAQLRSIIFSADPFDPASSRRRFAIGAPDGVSAVILAPLMKSLREIGPGIDIAIRQTLPMAGETVPERAWRPAFAELEARTLDIAIIPIAEIPPRFTKRLLYREDFVIAARNGHPFAAHTTLEHYLASEHLVVSVSGDPNGFVDEILARDGCARRIALTVPNFMFAMTVVADSDLLCAIPRRYAQMFSARFNVLFLESPFAMGAFGLHAVAMQSAMADPGIAWLLEQLPGDG